MKREEAIERIKAGLKARSGKRWSVRGGSGTAWGWIRIKSMPSQCVDGHMTPEAVDELKALLGTTGIGTQGEQVPDSDDYYQEFVDRAEGREPTVIGVPYWD